MSQRTDTPSSTRQDVRMYSTDVLCEKMSQEMGGSAYSYYDQFIHIVRTRFTVVPKSYTKKSLWDVQLVLTRKQEEKENKNQYLIMKTDTFKGCEDTTSFLTVSWCLRPIFFICQSYIRSHKDVPPVFKKDNFLVPGDGVVVGGWGVVTFKIYKNKCKNSIFKRKRPPQLVRGFRSHVEQNRWSRRCLHARWHRHWSRLGVSLLRDKSILGTVSSLKQGSQQDVLKKQNKKSVQSQTTIQNDHFGWTRHQTEGNMGHRKNRKKRQTNKKNVKLLLSLCHVKIIKVSHKNSGFTPEPSNNLLQYITFLSIQAGPTVFLFCPEQLSKPVLRT